MTDAQQNHPSYDQDDVHTEEEILPDQALTLREVFGQKLVDFASMEKMVRWITALGLAQIIVAVLLMGLEFLDLPGVSVAEYTEAYLAVPVLIACLLFQMVA